MHGIVVWLLALVLAVPLSARAAPPAEAEQEEFFTTAPLVANGLLFVASAEQSGHQGHLRVYDPASPLQGALWDAAEHIPLPGIGSAPGDLLGSDPPQTIHPDNLFRTVFTRQGAYAESQTLVTFSSATAESLQQPLGAVSPAAAAALVNTVRGREGCSEDNPLGNSDNPVRLWGIRRSAPVLVGNSALVDAARQRDTVVYVGAEDGMLHAFFIAGGSDEQAVYGTELWAYLPGALLPYLEQQPFTEPDLPAAVHVDGTAVAGDFFLDLDADGRREWRTLLAATATVATIARSCLFVLDVTDPYQPELLWEQWLPGENVGRTQGLAIGRVGLSGIPDATLFLSAAYAEPVDRDGWPSLADGAYGLHLLALDLASGALVWQFSSAYEESTSWQNEPPAVPALMDIDADGHTDYVVCGDLGGRLWALEAGTGSALGDGPVYVVPGGVNEPIGAGVAVQGSLAVFGTGGVDAADDQGSYALYAVVIEPDGATLQWSYPLALGEKVWARPVLDGFGNLLAATAIGYQSAQPGGSTAGRLIVIRADGEASASVPLEAAAVARAALAEGLLVSVTLTGDRQQYGSLQRQDLSGSNLRNQVRISSWRML